MNRAPAGSQGPPERDPEENGRAGGQATPRGHPLDSASRPAPGRRAHAPTHTGTSPHIRHSMPTNASVHAFMFIRVHIYARVHT